MSFTPLQAYKAFFANILSKSIKLAISFFLISFLARNLPVEVYASYDASLIFYTFIIVLGNLGFNEYVLNNLIEDKDKLTSIFVIDFTVGLTLASILFVLSYFNSMNSELTNNNLKILSIAVVLFLLKSYFSSICIINRKLSFVSYISGLSSLIGISITLFLFYKGYVNYLLSINVLIIEVVEFLIYYFAVSKSFDLSFTIKFPKEIISFSKYQYSFNLINYFSRNIDNIFIVTFMGVVSFGYYARSYQLLMLIIMLISDVVYNIYHRYLLNFSSEKNKMFLFFENTLMTVSYFVLILSVFLSFNSKFIINLIFGVKWQLSASYFQVLSFTIGSQVLLTFFGPLFQIYSNGKLLLTSILCSITLVVISLFIGVYLNHDIYLFCILYLVSNFILLIITCLIYFKFIKHELPQRNSLSNFLKLVFYIFSFYILLFLLKNYSFAKCEIYFFIFSSVLFFIFLFFIRKKFITFFEINNLLNPVIS